MFRMYVLYYIIFIALYCIVLYCIVLYGIVMYCIVLLCIVLFCIVPFCIWLAEFTYSDWSIPGPIIYGTDPDGPVTFVFF